MSELRRIVCEEYNDAYCAVRFDAIGVEGGRGFGWIEEYAIWTGFKFITGWYATMEAAWRAAFAALPVERRVL